ncbi:MULTISPECIES: hypothetical protein [unclassified Thiocapsa]|uniref:hypothetical protein n=1 Tax=unclassified Thiocapsa TaxID=2641286 RepID=UPI0035B2ED0D
MIACLHRIANIRTGRANRLIWLYDIHLLAGTLEPDQWRSLEALARARGFAGLLLDGLLAASARLGTRLPDETVETLRDSAASQWRTPAGFTSERAARPARTSRLARPYTTAARASATLRRLHAHQIRRR